MRECIHCGDEFNERSPIKRQVGGRINECPSCVESNGGDPVTQYLGVMAGDGKMAGVTILKFESDDDRKAYAHMWRNNSGQNVGKSCQIGGHITPTRGLKFTTVQKTEATNHKGKL